MLVVGCEEQWLCVVTCMTDFYAFVELVSELQPLAFKSSSFYVKYFL